MKPFLTPSHYVAPLALLLTLSVLPFGITPHAEAQQAYGSGEPGVGQTIGSVVGDLSLIHI